MFIDFSGLPNPSILRQKGICTTLVRKRISKIICDLNIRNHRQLIVQNLFFKLINVPLRENMKV